MIERFEPDDDSSLTDLLLHQEMLLIKCNRLIDIVKRVASIDCTVCGDKSLSDDAKECLRMIGVVK